MKNIVLGPLREGLYAVLVWVLLLLVYHGIYGYFFPLPGGLVGHDFSLALTGYLDGFIWFKKNGISSVPWFSPAACGGMPAFADPQSGYYSLPQWLTFIVDPLKATYFTLLVFASVGYFGMWLLARRIFRISLAWSLVAAALYFLNTFLPYRTILGETGYHGLTLSPWLALILLWPTRSIVYTIGYAILAGFIAAYWFQSGLPTLMVPAALGVAIVLLAYRLRHNWPSDLLLRMILSVVVCVALSASKLVAALSYYGHFERTQYRMPGFPNILALFKTNVLALFYTSESAARYAMSSLYNIQWTVLPQEWAYSFTAAPLLVLLLAFLVRIRRQSTSEVPWRFQWPVIGILLIALIPLTLQFYTPSFNAWLKQVPLIGATPWPMRWMVIWLVGFPLLVAMAAENWVGMTGRISPLLASLGMVMLIGLQFIDQRSYYVSPQKNLTYDSKVVVNAYHHLAAGGVDQFKIHFVGVKTDPKTGAIANGLDRNDLMVEGVSQLFCYAPIFGYRLEKFPMGKLGIGDVMAERDGYLNIKNPACYVFPDENGCLPGDNFRVSQKAAAEAFVSYHPFPFAKSKKQQWADLVTMSSLILTLAYLLILWPGLLFLRRRGRPDPVG